MEWRNLTLCLVTRARKKTYEIFNYSVSESNPQPSHLQSYETALAPGQPLLECIMIHSKKKTYKIKL